MRWIFLTLFFANLAVFAWGMVVTSKPPSPKVASKKSLQNRQGVSSIVLISEVDGNGASLGGRNGGVTGVLASGSPSNLPQGVGEELLLESEGGSSGKGEKLCDMVGPFGSLDDAQILVERLSAVEIESKAEGIDLPAGERFQVRLPPFPTQEEAFRRLSELQANGVDSYVIRKGDMANSISLGLFRKKSFADAHIDHLSSLGIEAEIEIIEDTVREIWVVLKRGEGLKMSSLTWKRALDEINNVEIRQNFCLGVASGEKFH